MLDITRYLAFRASSWKKSQYQEVYCSERNHIDEIGDLIEHLVILKREVHALRQLRELYANIKGVSVDSIRNINMKNFNRKTVGR